jgi:hypothetical protein
VAAAIRLVVALRVVGVRRLARLPAVMGLPVVGRLLAVLRVVVGVRLPAPVVRLPAVRLPAMALPVVHLLVMVLLVVRLPVPVVRRAMVLPVARLPAVPVTVLPVARLPAALVTVLPVFPPAVVCRPAMFRRVFPRAVQVPVATVRQVVRLPVVRVAATVLPEVMALRARNLRRVAVLADLLQVAMVLPAARRLVGEVLPVASLRPAE